VRSLGTNTSVSQRAILYLVNIEYVGTGLAILRSRYHVKLCRNGGLQLFFIRRHGAGSATWICCSLRRSRVELAIVVQAQNLLLIYFRINVSSIPYEDIRKYWILSYLRSQSFKFICPDRHHRHDQQTSENCTFSAIVGRSSSLSVLC
jgi:hypothetical protein